MASWHRPPRTPSRWAQTAMDAAASTVGERSTCETGVQQWKDMEGAVSAVALGAGAMGDDA